MPVRTAREARDGRARARRRARAGDRALDGVLADDGDHGPRSLVGRERGGAREWGVVRAAATGPPVVPVGAGCRGRAGDPRRPSQEQLGADAADVADRAASLDDLEGAPSARRQPQRRTQRPQTTRRYEWTEAGALLHIDAFELPKFDRPGHWAHGDRSERHKTRRAGKIKVIGVIDDHTRLAYCEIHAAETAVTVSATLTRATQWFTEQGCGPVQAVMSDNAKCYAESHLFAA